jgi:thiamine biosynthesis lipoprotein ApbE
MVIDFEAIGTVWKIEVFDTVSAAAAQKMQSAVLKRINTFDKQYSRFRDDSLITLMSREAGRYTLPADAKPLLDLYEKLYEVSSSKVTPLIGQTLEEAGYDASYSLKPGKLHKLPKWEDVIEYSFPYLTLKKPALLDFGAAGKGYLIDIIADLISKSGVKSYLKVLKLDWNIPKIHRWPSVSPKFTIKASADHQGIGGRGVNFITSSIQFRSNHHEKLQQSGLSPIRD